ncbi:MAG TPA: CapA family protein [Firmicutes bacterium]|nr:CapA family protein [Bacillota bacterium]
MFGSKGASKWTIYLVSFFAILIVPAFLFWFSPAGWQALPLNSGPGENCVENGIEEGEATVPVGLPAPPEEPLFQRAVVAAVGDIMIHKTQFMRAHNPEDGSFNFGPSFEVITPYLQQADLIVGNLETTFGGEERGYSAYPRFNSPDEAAQALRGAGFDLLCTVNNHCLDSGEQGLYRTIDVVEEAGMKQFGTYKSRQDRDCPLIVEVNGIRLAFLAYTYGTNGLPIPEGRGYIVNLLVEEKIEADIARARQGGADLIILYLHWGEEYLPEPTPEQKRWARVTAEAGADIILGSHPHVIQPMEYIDLPGDGGNGGLGSGQNNGGGKEVFVAYSMGNFLSNQHRVAGSISTDDVEYGQILYLHLEKNLNTGESFLRDVEYDLTWVNRNDRHRILPLCCLLDEETLSEDIMALPASLAGRLEKDRERLQDRLENPGATRVQHGDGSPVANISMYTKGLQQENRPHVALFRFYQNRFYE